MFNKKQKHCKDILNQKTANRLILAMWSTLIRALKEVYNLFQGSDNNTAMIIFKNSWKKRKKQRRNDYWAAVGYNFRSNIYSCDFNSFHKKIKQKVFIN